MWRIKYLISVIFFEPAWLWVGLITSFAAWLVSPLIWFSEDSLLLSGVVIEILGIIIVAVGLIEARRSFDAPTIPGIVGSWFRRIAAAFKRRSRVELSGTAISESESVGSLTLRKVLKSDATIEQRISYLLTEVQELQTSVSDLRKEVRKGVSATNERLSQIEQKNQAELSSLSNKLSSSSIGNLGREFAGILLISSGIVLTSFPDGLFQLWIACFR